MSKKGLKEKTEWVSSDDALLAYDVNGNGVIDDGSELFGTSTILASGEVAKSGFEALANLDSNGDGIIDVADDAYEKLLIWQDKNKNGISEADELYSLEDLNIESISLTTDSEGEIRTSIVTYKDGHTTSLGEFDFAANYYDTREKETIEISGDIDELPDVMAIGAVASLHTLMQLDESGVLKGYVEEFAKASTKDERKSVLTKILYNITGAENVVAGSRGSNFDAQKLTVIEQIMGKDFVGTDGRNPVNTAAGILQNLYDDIFNVYYTMLESQVDLKDYMSLLYVTTDDQGVKTIHTELFDAMIQIQSDRGKDVTDLVAKMGMYIKSINKNNINNFVSYMQTYAKDTECLKKIVDYCGMTAIVSLELLKTIVSTGEKIEIIGEATDDVSGVISFSVSFQGPNNKIMSASLNSFYWDENNIRKTYEDGKFHGFIEPNAYDPSGEYKICSIFLSDMANNSSYYHKSDFSQNTNFENIQGLAIQYTNTKEMDVTPPEFVSLKILSTQVETPGIVEVVGEAVDDVSGVISFSVSFEGPYDKTLTASLNSFYWDENNIRKTYEDGKFHGEIDVNQYNPSGEYKISSIFLSDMAGNSSYYHKSDFLQNAVFEDIQGLSIQVVNNGRVPDVTTGTSNGNLISQISNSASDALIAVDYSSKVC